ncbi:sulfatase [bacterium]|nr:sulfatase [bacterium]RQV93797.1 MAG: heparan N-sulfatase [bacterium]
MKRREFLKQGLVIPAGLYTGALSLNGCQSLSKRPNILFAIADDWGWPHAGVYGDPVVKTPHFDRVANEGVLFNHAYVTAPSCTPSRNSILTGQYHWRLGPGASLWSTLDPTMPVYPLLLQQAGYHVGSWRKSWGPGGELTGWEDYPAGKPYSEGFSEFLSARPKDAPFCFWLGSSDPHRPYVLNSGADSGIDLDQIRLSGYFPDNGIVRRDVADYYFEVQGFDHDLGNAIEKLEEIGELENTIIVVTGDNGMPFPRCKSNLYDSGVRAPLAIRWGSRIKKRGRVIEDFVSLSDLAPTFLQIAGVNIPSVMTGQSLFDLLISDEEGFVTSDKRGFVLCGKERHVPAQEGHMGGYPCRSIRTHDFLYIRNFKPERWPSGTPNYQKAAIPGAWLADCDNSPTKTYITENRNRDAYHSHLWELAFGMRPAEELYDCRKDPDQLNNIADDPAFAEIKNQLAEHLIDLLTESRDPRVLGEGDRFDQYPYYGGAPKHPSFESS